VAVPIKRRGVRERGSGRGQIERVTQRRTRSYHRSSRTEGGGDSTANNLLRGEKEGMKIGGSKMGSESLRRVKLGNRKLEKTPR